MAPAQTNELTPPNAQLSAFALAVETAPRVDGKLDDPCWQEAVPISRFTQVLPREGEEPTERTDVRFVFTRDHLYIGIRCFDSAPQQIVATQMKRDSDFQPDAFVVIAFDTFRRRHDGYYFAVNPIGARTDGLIQNFSDRNRDWDAVWNARTQIDESGWTAEIAIPFKSLSFDPATEFWGCNIERVIRRKQEIVRWTVLSRARSATTVRFPGFGRPDWNATGAWPGAAPIHQFEISQRGGRG